MRLTGASGPNAVVQSNNSVATTITSPIQRLTLTNHFESNTANHPERYLAWMMAPSAQTIAKLHSVVIRHGVNLSTGGNSTGVSLYRMRGRLENQETIDVSYCKAVGSGSTASFINVETGGAAQFRVTSNILITTMEVEAVPLTKFALGVFNGASRCYEYTKHFSNPISFRGAEGLLVLQEGAGFNTTEVCVELQWVEVPL